MYKRFPLSLRIFLVMLFVVITTMTTMGMITFYQYIKAANEYNNKRLERKEQIIIETFDYLISSRNTRPGEVKEKIGNKIYEISDINNLDINFYTLDGKYLIGNKSPNSKNEFVPKEVLKSLNVNNDRIIVIEKSPYTGGNYTSVFRYLYNNDYQPISVINLPYLHDDSFLKKDFYSLLYRYLAIMFIILILSGILSWVLSQTLTRKIKKVAQRLSDTGALSDSRPILYNYIDEVSPLIHAYNTMVVKFKEQTEALIKAEKDNAWQEMARQVAHEIKNPLTPMKLEVQSFQMKFNPQVPDAVEKLDILTKSLCQQIDTISSIAEAFSDFAKMPIKKDQKLNIIKVIQNALEIFPSQNLILDYTEDPVILSIDPNLVNRILTNLVKNAFQAIPDGVTPQITVKIRQDLKQVYISVIDNGSGIPEKLQPRVFTPQFSTKTSGSGLGLAIIKKIIEEYNGSIGFVSEEGVGTTFQFEIPKSE